MIRKITALKSQQRNPQRINVYLNGEFAFGLSRFAGAWLDVGQELSEQKIADLQLEDQRETAYQLALKYLSYRMRSEKEVRQNLYKHNVPESIIEFVLEKLKKSDLINDDKFAHDWVENRLEFQPRSCRMLDQELRQKGISTEIINQSLIGIDENELAYLAGLKKSQRWNYHDLSEFKRKLSSFLARRGFSYDVIIPTVKRILAEQRSTE